jgi:molybdopterin molybdotransferase
MAGEKALLGVDEALERILASVGAPIESEELPLAEALGRTLAADVVAKRTQPPVDVSAMDGYAVRAADVATPGARVKVVGESAAGRGYGAAIRAGECARIFTGAPVPPGADAILLQEDAAVADGWVSAKAPPGPHIRAKGLDFTQGETALAAGTRLGAAELALTASTNTATVKVARRPRVAIIASGDELAPPGSELGPAQIVSTNNLTAAALVLEAGGAPIDLGIFRDDLADLQRALGLARQARADVIVTLGGASVGDRDLLRPALEKEGMALDFWRIAMRPGKPLIFGRLGHALVLGLPGNPVAAFVCGLLFLKPLLRALQGDPEADADRTEIVLLGSDLPANKARRDYLRARLTWNSDGLIVATPQPLQDSSLLTELARSQALIVREIGEGPAKAGEPCRILRLRDA